MEKRERNSGKSPVSASKRPKSSLKHKKTSYFIPQNTLAYNPQSSISDKNKKIHAPKDRLLEESRKKGPESTNPSIKDSSTENVSESFTPEPTETGQISKTHVQSTKLYDRSLEQHSSDDSFEGVRWQPTTSPNKYARPILSSPLKNADLGDRSLRNVLTAETVVNELTDSVLCKYGLGMQNTLSQTPKNHRTSSDVAKSTLDMSPTLTRSKSFDPRSLQTTSTSLSSESAKVSNLNIWLDKFQGPGHVTKAPSEPPMKAIQNSHVPSTNSNDDASSEEDPFLDDDTFLADLKIESFTTQGIPFQQAPASKLDTPTELAHDAESASILHRDSPKSLSQRQSALKASTPSASSPTVSTTASPNASPNTSLNASPKNSSPQIIPEESDPFSDDLDVVAIEKSAVATQATSEPTLPTKNGKRNTGRLSPSPDSFEEENVGAKLSYTRADFVRYQIMSIMQTTYPHQNFKRKQLILTVADADEQTTKIVIRGDSAELNFQEGDIINIIITSPESPKLVDNNNNLIIWNPDTLISSTVVADQLFCPRKTVMNKRYVFPGEATIPLIVGTTVHEIFQACFITEQSSPEYMEQLLEVETKRRLLEIYSMGDVLEETKDRIRKHFSFIEKWFNTFFKKPPSIIPTNKHQQNIKFSVADVLDVEESIWSPMFGIKGMADVTLKANLEGESATGQFLLPMEIKTSKEYLSHHAQAALYSLLFKDRYNANISSFLMVYTSEEGSTKKHDISIPDLRSLVNLRNRISPYIKSGTRELPDIMRQQKCDNCVIQSSCMTVNYLLEHGTPENSGLNDGVYEDLTEHLVQRQEYSDYLNYWDDLLTSEEEFVSRFNKDLWILTSKEREEEQGKALSGMIITEKSEFVDNTSEFIYKFQRRDFKNIRPIDAAIISKYDRVIISDESGHFALAQGFVKHIDCGCIIISTRRKLVSTEVKNDRFHRAAVLRPTQSQSPQGTQTETVIFRIDKDEMFYGMGVARFNILNLFLRDGDTKRRKLIVDLDTPRFSPVPVANVKKDHFNSDQIRAFNKVFQTKDYCLILGMPGTGKTTVIAHLIRMLVEEKKSVLLSSYTNSAVDNILLKVKEFGIDFIRIGNTSRVHPDIRPYIPGSDEKCVENYEDFIRIYQKPLVVAATCLSMRDLAFNVRERFDYCIVDEASQVSMPLSLGPLSRCDKFVLVGDHYQLPPLVVHPNVNVKKGLSRSLFQILADEHPQSIVELSFQYRMCKEIMLISNALVYNNRLQCGSETVAKQSLTIPNPEALAAYIDPRSPLSHRWLSDVFKPENKVLFLNHDNMNAYERKVGENVSNLVEVELIRQIVESLCLCGVDESKIGVMTLYRSQLKLLVQCFKHRPRLEILTADRFQGRDKECIIISFVRSNKEKRVGDLLKDWRRVNVAVTRARSKLITVASKSTLSHADSIKDFVYLAEQKNWIYNLPSSAYHVYQLPKPKDNFASQEIKKQPIKFGEKIISKHPVVKDILSDMNAIN
ncbi:putative bifunctional ATP-dependent DNA helicase/ssDNA endodeoxyribonuclease [Clavispora lusitaniae]|uniref:DNA replication ATP-dependent helicase/nuclease DNA2 n=1 Tax=Clavispora lusitaniae TaxID=36911 RepID=A0AA91PYP1_CLALS|nr:putative bifunctional ATP-dependent DNA helicase/ssDNA endodeoxyribonuclease [Clavispora lusitaniae]